jgi:hypothetical protein
MTSLREMKEKQYIPTKTFLRMLTKGTVSFGFVFITNVRDIKKISSIKKVKKEYNRPPRRYTLPAYNENMKYSDSNEKYLRPTLYCDHRCPEIIALAHELGAFKKSEWEYCEAAFEWTKRNLLLEISLLNELPETLKRGTGTCVHINNVFVALCRAAGIKARYKMFAAIQSQATYDEMYDPIMQRWYDALGYFSLEADIEVYINGKWEVANTAPTPERQAAMSVPITKFGEESLGVWFNAIPGTMFWTESIPYGLDYILRFLFKIAPGTIDNINANVNRLREKGVEIIKQHGGEKQYDEFKRADFKPMFPTMNLQKRQGIVFER